MQSYVLCYNSLDFPVCCSSNVFCCFESHLLQGVVMLPSMFGHDFRNQIGRYVTLVDSNSNEFQVLVERPNGCIYDQRVACPP
jgi:hypothetical protein